MVNAISVVSHVSYALCTNTSVRIFNPNIVVCFRVVLGTEVAFRCTWCSICVWRDDMGQGAFGCARFIDNL